MWEFFFGVGRKVTEYMGHLDRKEWAMVLGVVVLVGIACMRGFAGKGRI